MYWAMRDFGAAAQAGFGIGTRIMQMIFLPAMAISFAAAPIAGQNYGARRLERVRETFRSALIVSCVIMAAITALLQWQGETLARVFTQEPEVVAVTAGFLHVISWNFVATGIVFTCSSLFQGLGNTWPAMASTATRLVTFALPAIWLARQGGFELRHLWYLSVATVLLQAAMSLLLLWNEFRRKGLLARAGS
jgi:Na+-driven multidrug efflux pump